MFLNWKCTTSKILWTFIRLILKVLLLGMNSYAKSFNLIGMIEGQGECFSKYNVL